MQQIFQNIGRNVRFERNVRFGRIVIECNVPELLKVFKKSDSKVITKTVGSPKDHCLQDNCIEHIYAHNSINSPGNPSEPFLPLSQLTNIWLERNGLPCKSRTR